MPLGFHVSKHITRNGKEKNRSMLDALRCDMKLLRSWGFEKPCAQIFVSGPRNFNENLTEDDKKDIRNFVRTTGAILVIHGSYVDNPWNRAPGSIHNIKQELKIAANIGATGVIVHLGAGAADNDNLQYVLDTIADIPNHIKTSVILWLEIHTAKSSEFTYETPEKLIKLFERVSKINVHGLKIGLCIDTAHLFSCGLSLDTFEKANNWLNQLPNVPLMIHLNDSASKFGSGIDVHQMLCKGNIWREYHPSDGNLPIEKSGLFAILQWIDRNNITAILERDFDGINHDLALISGVGFS